MIIDGYQEKILVKYSEIEQNLAMKPFALLNFLQDIASKNAEDLGFGYSYIHPLNYAWFLLKYRMEFNEYPFDVQELILKTEPRGYNKLFAYRDFELYNNDNKLLARIHSLWSLVETNTRALVPIANAISDNKFMIPFQKREDDLLFKKISPITNPILEKEFEVRYNDLDVNGHANNGNYVIWAFEPLSFEFKNSHKIKTIDMVYKKETKFDDKIISQIEFVNENISVHKLLNYNKEELFLMECEWV